MTGCTIFSSFKNALQADKNAVAVMRPSGSIRYAQFHEYVLAYAEQLLDRQTQPGGVAILTHDPFELLAAFFACSAVGRPALPLDPRLPSKTISDLLSENPLSSLITDRRLSECAGKLQIITGESASGTHLAFNSIDDIDHEDPEFYWGLTSGTTGEPKLFARRQSSWIASFAAAESVFAFQSNARILIPGPLHHSLFLYAAVHALCRGHTAILPGGQFRAPKTAEALTQATHLYVVPFMLNEILKYDARAPELDVIFSGGAKLDDKTRKAADAVWPNADLVEFYGASETSFVTFHSTRQPANPGSVGRPFPSVKVEIRGSDGEALEAGLEGGIFVSSPMLYTRYLNGPSAEYWFSTGDTGFIDGDGCLHLTGRANRMIKSKGLRIHPEKIESILGELPEIRRVAVVGLPDDLRGAVAAAVVELSSPHSLARRDLFAHCRERLGASYCPQHFFSAENLPLTSSGKVAVALVQQDLISRKAHYREIK